MLACSAAALSAAPDQLSTAQQGVYAELIDELRCPECQNQNLAESDSAVAQSLRARVAAELAAGATKEQVINGLEAQYGASISYRPPVNAQTLVLWALPPVFLLVLMCWWFLGQNPAANASKPSSKLDQHS